MELKPYSFSVRQMSNRQSPWTSVVWLLAVAAMLAAGTAAASPVTITIKPSFNRLYRPGRWMPVMIELHNQGSDLDDTLCLTQKAASQHLYSLDKMQGQTRFLQSVHLPKNSRKRYHFYVFPDQSERLEAGLFSAKTVTSEVVIPIPEDRGFLVACGRFERELNLLFNDPSSKIMRAATIAPEELPDESIGYDAVDIVYLNDCPLEKIQSRQWNALLQWLGEGGTLIVGGGLFASELNNSPLRDHLPFTLAGTRPLESFRSLAQIAELPREREIQSISIARITGMGETAEVLLVENGIPLAVRSRYKAGRIIFLTFDINDPPFITIPRFTGIWQTLLGLEYPTVPADKTGKKKKQRSWKADEDLVPDTIADFLRENLHLPIISLHLIVIFLVLYVLLAIPLDYFVARKLGHVFFSVYTFPFIVAAFIIAGIGVGLTTTHVSTRQSQHSTVWGSVGEQSWRGMTYARFFVSNQGWTQFKGDEYQWSFRGFAERDCDVFLDHDERRVRSYFTRQAADNCAYDWRLPAEPIVESCEVLSPKRSGSRLRVKFAKPDGWTADKPYLVLLRRLERQPDNDTPPVLIGACSDRSKDLFLDPVPAMEIPSGWLTGKTYALRKRLPPELLQALQERVSRIRYTPGFPRLFLVMKIYRTIGPLMIEKEQQECFGDTVLVLEIDLSELSWNID